MERATDEAKRARATRRGREIKRVADTGEPPVVIPVVVVVAVDVHVALIVVPLVERERIV